MSFLSMGEEFQDRVCVITGGTGVLGGAIAEALDSLGAKVIVADLDVDAPDRKGSSGIRTIKMDVSSEDSVVEAFTYVLREYGGLGVLINCAGYEQACPLMDLSLDDWNRMLAVHLTGTFLCAREAMGIMTRQRSGKIINVSSQLAYKGAVGLCHYTAAKAGVLGLTKALAREAIEDGVFVNAIAPGPVDSPVLRACGEDFLRKKLKEMPIGRVGMPSEIVGTALLLASSAGEFYVGQTLAPCGGDVML